MRPRAPSISGSLYDLAATRAKSYGILFHATARPEKEWPEASWVALGRILAARGASLVLPWGTQTEHARSGRIAAALGNAEVPEGQPLDRMARLVAGAWFVIGTDTGLLHLAAAFGVPLVAIFVGSEPSLTGPMGEGPIAVVGGKRQLPSVEDVMAALESSSSKGARSGKTKPPAVSRRGFVACQDRSGDHG